MKRLLLAAVTALFVLPAIAHALPRSMPDPQVIEHRGSVVTPRTIEFGSLPRVSSEPYSGPIGDPHAEGVWEEAERFIEQQKEHPNGPDLQNLGAHLTIDTTPAGAAGLTPFAPIIGGGFEGITQGPYIPSEPTVAAGPLNVFSPGNVNVTVTNKDGSNRVETDGATFFGVTPGEGAISDAQCYYDAVHGRFVAVAFTTGTSPSNYSNFYLLVSKTNDARGAWWQYKLDMTKDGTSATSNWSDYESIGITEDKLVLTGQQFSFSTNSYQYPKVRVLDRAALYAGGAVSFVDFTSFATPSGGDTYDTFVTKCARNLTPGDPVAHLLCVRIGGGSSVTYREITGSPSAPVMTTPTRVTVSTYSAPPNATQKGTATTVPTNDCRPGDFVVRNGVLVVAWHIGATISSSSVSAVRLLRLRTSDLAVLTDETFGQANTFYFYPCATVDSAGTVYLGFGRSSSTEYPSAYATGRRPSDASIEASTLLKAGLSFTTQSRWGDYTGIDNDASLSGPGGTSAWYSGQWPKTSNAFGTWVNKLSFTYGQVGGIVVDDCDGSTGTTSDRAALAGVTVALKQGATTLLTTTTDATGAYNFGYLEAGTYDIVVTPPAGGSNVDAIAGTGGTSQTRIAANDMQVVVTTTQVSTGNLFAVTSTHALPVTTNISPIFKVVGDPGFTLTVNGSGFTSCSVVRVDGSDRTTTWINSGQLTATIPAGDLAVAAARSITVFTPTPGGGTSNAQFLTVSSTPDTQAPVATLTSPVGGESWAVGSTHNITWTATDNIVVANVDLALSTDGGATFPVAIASALANTGTYAWTLPFTPSATARVRVTAHDGFGNPGADSSHVNFAIAGWTVTASAGANGTITPSGAIVVADGATPSFTISPATGYHVLDVLVNAVSAGAVTNLTLPAVHGNTTVAASFAPNTYTLNVTVSGNGTVGKSPDQATYDYGTLVTLTATPTSGYTFAGWSGDTSASGNPLTVVMNQNRNLTATFGLHTYVWNQTAAASWATATNWTPTRTTPATDDVLIFNGGGTPVATNVPSQTIGQLLVSNNTAVSLQSGVSSTLAISGGTGTDLDVPSGCSLALNGNSALSLALATGATGSIGGAVTATISAQRLLAVDAGALVFKGGSTLTLGTGFSGNVFGTGTGSSGLNSVVFQAGSMLVQVAGSNPFGAGAPSSTVVFQSGSRYRLDGAVTPAMAGRTYADFEYNYLGTLSPTGSTAFTVDSLVVTQGTLNLNVTGGGTIRGNVRVKTGTTLGFSPALGATFTFGGASTQQVAVFGTFTTTANASFVMNNPAGVSLATNLQVAGPVSFTSGRITTGANSLILTAAASMSGAAQGTGWVAGNLRRNVGAGTVSRTFDVGDPTTYAPVTVAFNSVATAFDMTAATSAGDHPSLFTSDLDASRTVNRTWTLTPATTPSLTGADATFNFAAGDVDGLANTANFVVRRYSGGWTSPVTGARTATSTQATGLTAFGDFAVGEKFAYFITASAGANGAITPSGAVSVTPGANQSFTITPDANYHVADVLVDAVSAGAVTGYTFNNVLTNHTIAASFTGDAQTLTTGVTGSGSVAKLPNLPNYPYGSTVQLTATPSAGWAFTAWSGDLSGSTNPANLLMNGAKSVTAAFADTAAPVVTVTAPNGGESLNEGAVVPVTWIATDNAAVTAIDVLLSRTGSGGTYDTLAAAVSNSGTYNWTVTSPATSSAFVKVVARDAAGNAAADTSDAAFTIVATTGVEDGPVTRFALAPIVPNPTHGAGRTVFALPRAARVHVSLLDVQGREALVLADGEYPAGRHSVGFGARQPIGAGLYFLRMRVENGPTFTHRIVVAR
jgi:uncharacterized repeat protein (TIGR02543 family)